MKHLAIFALPALVLAAAPASAAILVTSGTTVGGPVFTRTLAGTPPTQLSLTGAAVNYAVVAFTVGSSGSYSFAVDASYDSFLSLYANAFNPAAALSNIQIAVDDTDNSRNPSFVTTLLAGTAYFAVVSAFESGDAGTFRLTIDGPGTITPAGVIPEPATWAMMLAGFAMVGAALRYRRRSTLVTFG